MLFVAIIPGYVWAILLLAAYAPLTHLAWNRLVIRHWVMTGLLGLMTLQTVTGVSVAVATQINPISLFACRVGVFGAMSCLAFSLFQIAALVFLSSIWPRDVAIERKLFAT